MSLALRPRVEAKEERRMEIREIEEMLRLRRSTSEDVASGTEFNEFVKNDKTHQFEIRELASALSGFIKQFRVEGIEAFVWREFMEKVKPEVVRMMKENRQMKVLKNFSSEMERDSEFRILMKEEATGDFREWYHFTSILRNTNRLTVDLTSNSQILFKGRKQY